LKYADCYYRKHDFSSKRADHVLNTTVNQELPINLAPTSSTTAQLVMGDALAVCLMEIRDFKPELLIYHPWRPICRKPKPMVTPDAPIKKKLF
jgi:arabinose-5-phosphate isomerase